MDFLLIQKLDGLFFYSLNLATKTRLKVMKYKGKRYYIRVIDDNGDSSILSDKNKTEFCKTTANKNAEYMWNHHGKMAYVIEA